MSNNCWKITIVHRYLLLLKLVSNNSKLKGHSADETLKGKFLWYTNTHAVLGLFRHCSSFKTLSLWRCLLRCQSIQLIFLFVSLLSFCVQNSEEKQSLKPDFASQDCSLKVSLQFAIWLWHRWIERNKRMSLIKKYSKLCQV